MKNKIISILTMGIKNKGFFKKLLDKNDPEVAASNFFVMCLLAIGLVLLIVPVFVLIIEAWYNHTVGTDLNGMAAYIMAVAAIFTSAGITKIGVHYTDSRYSEKIEDEGISGEFTDISEESNECKEQTFGMKRGD